MARDREHTEAGYVFPIVVWLNERDAEAKSEEWVRRCDTPTLRPMRVVDGREEPDPSYTKQAQVVALTPEERITFRNKYVATGLCQVYRDRESAALDHPEIDWSRVGMIYGIPV